MAHTDIDELLNSMRAENELNSEKFAKALVEINNKLEGIASGCENSELIRDSLLNLKVELDNRQRFVSEKFESVKDSFEVLNEKHEVLTKNSDLKILFNILNENIEHFAQEVAEQKNIIDSLDEKFVDFRNDSSQKDEIISKISVVKEGIDEVNRGLQASIMDVNSSLRNITKTLMTMDVTDQNDIIKRELENIYLSANAILSSLEIVDQKNDELAKNIITKEDLSGLSDRIDESFANLSGKISAVNDNEQVISEIEKNRKELKAFSENISVGLSEYLASVKVAINDCVEEIMTNQKLVIDNQEAGISIDSAALEKLAGEIKSIEVVLSNQNEASVALVSSKLSDLSGVLDDFRTYIDSNHIGLETEITTKICALELVVQQASAIVAEKIDKWQVVVDSSIQSVEDLVAKNGLKINESLEEIANVKLEFAKLSESFASVSFANNGVVSGLEDKFDEKFEKLKEDLSGLNGNFELFKSCLEHSTLENKHYLSEIMDNTSEKIQATLFALKNEDKENELINIKTQIEMIAIRFDDLKMAFTSLAAENVEKILARIQSVQSEIGDGIQRVADIMDHNFQFVSKSIENSVLENRQNFGGLSAKLDTVITTGSDNVVFKVENLEAKVDMLGVDLSTDLEASSDMVKDFIEEYRAEKVKNSDDILTLSDTIKNLELELVTNSSKLNSALEDQLITLNGYVLTLKDLYERNNNPKELGLYAEKMLAVETSLHALGESFNDDLMGVQSKLAEYSRAVADISLETKGKLSQSLEEIGSLKAEFINVLEKVSNNDEEFSEKVNDIKNAVFLKFDELSNQVVELKENADSDLGSMVQTNLLNIEDKFTDLQVLFKANTEKLITDTEDFSTTLNGRLDDLKQEIGLINTDLSDLVATKTDAIAESFEPLKTAIDESFNKELEKFTDDIKSQMELSYLNFSSSVNDSIAETHDSYVHLEESYNTLVEKFEVVQSVIKDLKENQVNIMLETIKEIDKTQSDNFEKTNSLLITWKNELCELENKFDLSFSGLESAVKKGFEIQKAYSELNKKELKSIITPLVKKDELDASLFTQTDELRNMVSAKSEELKEELATTSTKTGHAISDLKLIVEDLNKKSETLAQTQQAERIEDLVNSLNEKIDFLAKSGEVDAVQEMMSALHEKVDVLAMSDDDARFEDLEEIIQALHEKVDIIVMTDESSHIEDLVQALHDKVDVIAATDDAELFNEIQDIKDLIDEQRRQIEAFGSEDSDLDKRLQSLSQEISNIDFEKSASDIKDAVMNAVLGVTDQITFAEETEEIKGFVEQRTEEINKNLLDVKKQLCSLASGSDAWDYSYTMQDIESDIAKLRLILNDISSSTSKEDLNEISKNMHKLASSVNSLHSNLTEEQINELRENVLKINDDVVSLSTRTNKLLLNSDESHKALVDGIDELNRVLAMFGGEASGESLVRKLDSINAAIATSANTDNVMREVMLYMGEWIDEASEKINNIAADTANLTSINSELCYLKSVMGNSDIIESIREKFEVQQKRIDTLETKIDRVMDLLENKLDTFNDKFVNLDNKINKLTAGIEKLASYVDEE